MSQETRKALLIVGVVAGSAVLVVLLGVGFFFLPGWKVRAPTCATTTQASQSSGGCLSTEQRLQAETNVRNSAVQALAGPAVLAAAVIAASVAWHGFRETRKLAADERVQTRRAEAYVPMVRSIIAMDNYLLSWDRWTRQQPAVWSEPAPDFAPPSSDEDLQEIAARVDAFGTEEVRSMFDKYREEAGAVRSHLRTWTDAQPRIQEADRRGEEPALKDRDVSLTQAHRAALQLLVLSCLVPLADALG